MHNANQQISQFIGNPQASPDASQSPVSPGANNIGASPQMGSASSINQIQPSSTLSPQMVMLNSMMRATPNSATNHSIGNGGFGTSYGQQSPQNQMMIQALQNGA